MNRNRRGQDGDGRYERYRNPASRPYQELYAERPGAGEGVLNRAGSAVGDFASGAQETVSNAASQTWETAASAAGQAREGVSNLAGQVAERASDLGGQVRQGALRAQDQYRQAVIDNPLAVGAVALAAGAAVGLMLPSTQTENRWMGETRENLVQAAEQAARGTIEKVRQVAGEAGRVAREAAEGQGLTAS